MEIFYTVIAGVLTFVFGQVFLKILIEPVHSMKGIIAKIAHKLILHANIYANPKSIGNVSQDNALREFRELSSELQASMRLVPFYPLTHRLFGLPSKKNIEKASRNLIGLSNGHDGNLQNQGILNSYSAQKVKLALDLHIPEGEYIDPEKENFFIKGKE